FIPHISHPPLRHSFPTRRSSDLFVQERERIIRQQQEAIRELSTPVLQVRERLLILPIIGVIDPQRARQLTEQLLQAIRTNRAKRSEEHTSELQSRFDLVCRLLLE